MKLKLKILVPIVTGIFLTASVFAQVGIGTSNPDASSGLEIDFTNKGFLPPRLTTDQRNAIINPAEGLMIFNVITGCLNYYHANSWYEICGVYSPFVCGTSTVTFNYNGSYVNYGTVVGANNKCWLDRNLGATQVATSSSDEASYGHLFQWGRLSDTHQLRNSPTTTTLSNSDVPGHENFILAPSFPYDWRSPQNNNLWQGVSGTNNPCPYGYRLPTQAEWDTERLSWNSNNAAGAFASPLKLPMAGNRSYFDGSVSYDGSYGDYWSSTVDGVGSWILWFGSSDASMSSYGRAYGFSVRCIKD